MYSTPPIPDGEVHTIAEPCPFCGSMRLTVGYDGQPANYFFVRCLQCGAAGPSVRSQSLFVGGPLPAKEIANTWNNRPIPSR